METYNATTYMEILKQTDEELGAPDGKKTLDEFNTDHMAVELNALFSGLDMDFYKACGNKTK